ncbi:unnamed protein product [Cladocopium goreaui]|uniref:Uncharacterized protein n=1 Tax=Cladocopium goreaui TaxID=2562237 RepID=A0A9P1C2F3_9DINO|nr:unnamed protein product [Cladocopium goreaui]
MVKGSRISWHLLLVLLCAGLMGCFVFWQYGATHRSDCLGDQLEKLIHLKDGGHLSDAEFQLAKAKLGLSTEALPDEPAASPAAVAAAPEVAVPSVAPVPVEEIEEEGATLLPRVPNHLQVQPAKWFYLPEDFRELPLLPKSIWDKSLDMDQLDFPLMQAILLRLLRNETIRIQVYGGSMTFGEGCCTSCLMRQRDCSWPTQVVARLRQTFPGATIALDHRARGGCDLECSLPEMVMTLSGSETAFDWLMLDFSQNGMGRKTTIEEIVRVCHFFLPKTLVMVIFNRDMVNKAGNYRDKNMYDNYRAVSQHYTLPFLNYEAAMQSFVAAGGNETLMWSSKSRHPKFSAHAYYADMVSYFCNKQLRKLEEVYTELDISDMTPTLRKPKDLQPDKDWMNPMQKQVNLATIDVCVFPLTQHVAREPSKDSPSESSTGHWKLYEDRHNKPGWICTTENGEAITFKVTFSEQPKLMVQFLRSYSNIGDAEILIDSPFRWKWKGNGNMGVRTNFTLKGGWNERISVTQNVLFVVVDKVTPTPQETTDATVSFRLTKGPKFKIISLISC